MENGLPKLSPTSAHVVVVIVVEVVVLIAAIVVVVVFVVVVDVVVVAVITVVEFTHSPALIKSKFMSERTTTG